MLFGLYWTVGNKAILPTMVVVHIVHGVPFLSFVRLARKTDRTGLTRLAPSPTSGHHDRWAKHKNESKRMLCQIFVLYVLDIRLSREECGAIDITSTKRNKKKIGLIVRILWGGKATGCRRATGSLDDRTERRAPDQSAALCVWFIWCEHRTVVAFIMLTTSDDLTNHRE